MKSQLSVQEKIDICRQNREGYDGQFFMAVRTTGIFCLPSCKARFPNEENIIFYPSKEKALKAGFRGCLRCRPHLYPNTTPNWLKGLIQKIQMSNFKLSTDELEAISGKDISTINRHFKLEVGQTPIQYHRSIIMEKARDRIQLGEDYRDVAFEYGFESVSGFRDAFYNQFGETPGDVSRG